MLAKKKAYEESSPRRSSRKAKPISKGFEVYEWKSSIHRKPSSQTLKADIPVEVQSRCLELMMVDQTRERPLLLSYMEKAVEQQCNKLWQLSGIKLKLQHLNNYLQQHGPKYQETVKKSLPHLDPIIEQDKLQEEPKASLSWKLQEEMKPQEVERRQQSYYDSEDEFQDLNVWSCPEELQVSTTPKLRKHQSAKLLCDNYQKQELIYSVETLIPRLHRQDLEHHFGQFH